VVVALQPDLARLPRPPDPPASDRAAGHRRVAARPGVLELRVLDCLMLAGHDAPHGAILEGGHVDLAGRVLGERGDRQARLRQQFAGPLAFGVPLHAPELAGTDVGIQVLAVERRGSRAAIDVAADDGATLSMAVLDDRRHQTGRVAALGRAEAVVALHDRPTVILAAGAGGRLEVDLFPVILPDVGNVEVAGLLVEAEAPGVAQAVGPDLRPGIV